MTTMRVVGECFFWYRLTRVFPDKFHRAVKRLCVCVCTRRPRVHHRVSPYPGGHRQNQRESCSCVCLQRSLGLHLVSMTSVVIWFMSLWCWVITVLKVDRQPWKQCYRKDWSVFFALSLSSICICLIELTVWLHQKEIQCCLLCLTLMIIHIQMD